MDNLLVAIAGGTFITGLVVSWILFKMVALRAVTNDISRKNEEQSRLSVEMRKLEVNVAAAESASALLAVAADRAAGVIDTAAATAVTLLDTAATKAEDEANGVDARKA